MKMKTKILQFLINLKFAILLLVCIAILSALGSIIEQDQSFEYYRKNYPLEKPLFGFLSYSVIFSVQLNQIYTSWFFFCLVSLLGICLTLCSFKQQLPLLEFSRRFVFLLNVQSLPVQKFLKKTKRINERCLLFLEKKDFYVHQQKNVLYAFKGMSGKIGPIFVHTSLVCILVGGLYGALGRFQAQEFLPKGEIVHIQNIFTRSFFSEFPQMSLRLNDFWVEYQNQRINQFYSDLSLVDNLGNEIHHQLISVNHPLSYKNLNLYQMDWGLLGIRVQDLQKELFQYPLILVKKTPKIWSSWMESWDGKTGLFLFIDELKQNAKIYDNGGKFVGTCNFYENVFFPGFAFKILELIPETGLQIKYDPSLPLIFTGFAFLIINTFLSYLTYSQIWFSLKNDEISMGGRTTRAKSSFEIECTKFCDFDSQS